MNNDKKELLKQIFEYHNWRQRIPLGGGLETPGANFASEWDDIFLPKSLSGQSFLDVGSNDGLFSFLAEQKGALKIVSTDIYYSQENASHMTDGWNDRGIRLAHEYLNSKVQIQSHGIYDLKKIDGTFEFVFCANVLAWLRDPYLALQLLAEKSSGTLFLREDISLASNAYPVLEWIHEPNAPDATRFFKPNRAFFEKSLTALGFRDIEFKLIDEADITIRKNRIITKYELPSGIKLYASPFASEAFSEVKTTHAEKSTYEYEGFVFFPRTGWIKKDQVIRLHQPEARHHSHWKSRLKRLAGKEDWVEMNYSIIAHR